MNNPMPRSNPTPYTIKLIFIARINRSLLVKSPASSYSFEIGKKNLLTYRIIVHILPC